MDGRRGIWYLVDRRKCFGRIRRLALGVALGTLPYTSHALKSSACVMIHVLHDSHERSKQESDRLRPSHQRTHPSRIYLYPETAFSDFRYIRLSYKSIRNTRKGPSSFRVQRTVVSLFGFGGIKMVGEFALSYLACGIAAVMLPTTLGHLTT